jgi:hypothetical protein
MCVRCVCVCVLRMPVCYCGRCRSSLSLDRNNTYRAVTVVIDTESLLSFSPFLYLSITLVSSESSHSH